MAEGRYTDVTLYRRMLRQARPYWPHIVGVFLLSLLSIPLALLSPLPLKIAVDSVIGAQAVPGFLDRLLPSVDTRSDTAVLWLAAGLLVAIALLNRLQSLGSSLLRKYTAEKLVLGFRARLFNHAQRLSLSYHDSTGTADSIYRIRRDASSIQAIAIDGVIPFITAAFMLASMIYIILRLNMHLGLIALTILPVLFTISWISRHHLRSQSREIKRLESSAQSVVQEALTAIRVVKAFGQEDREHERLVNRFSQSMRARLRLTLTESGIGSLSSLTTTLGRGAVLFMGVQQVLSGALTLGELLVVMSYLSQLYGPIRSISRRVRSVQSSLASAERAFALLDEEPNVVERPNAWPLRRASGLVAFRNASFAYDDDHPVLSNISFEIAPGTSLGIAGATGAGKTTLVSLLNRFYDPTAGQILLDGVDLRDYKLADLRNQFGIVLQDPVLLSASVSENIAYARPGATSHEIMEAAKMANAHEFIISLRQGYETQVGERGMLLSGGERQRIALARAFLKDAPILILDEPTSSVDMETEAGIMASMERLMKDRTTFMIAHRLSTLENCDALMVIEDGRLVEMRSDVSAVVREALAVGGLEATIRGGKANA